MIRLLVLLASFSFATAAEAVIVIAEWQDFSGAIPATGGMQSGSADIDLTTGGTIGLGTQLSVTANGMKFNDPGDTFWDLFFSGPQTEDITLTYDVLRTDGNGANVAPNLITWSYSLDGSAFTVAGSNSIEVGSNSETISFSGLSGFDTANDIQLRATFSGANGGAVNSLAFDNVQVSTAAVPEPSPFYILLVTGAGITLHRRFRCGT